MKVVSCLTAQTEPRVLPPPVGRQSSSDKATKRQKKKTDSNSVDGRSRAIKGDENQTAYILLSVAEDKTPAAQCPVQTTS
jgi:hypothetical protein